MAPLDRTRLASLLEAEQAAYSEHHPRSRALFEEAGNLFGRVPMTWMNMWSGGFPLYLDQAQGNRITDVDGHTYIDFALGDTGAMAGHSPAPTVAAVTRRMGELEVRIGKNGCVPLLLCLSRRYSSRSAAVSRSGTIGTMPAIETPHAAGFAPSTHA